ncbi:MAG TPA: glycosyltransferase family 4 protein, partial [Actinomycetota bacterium]|nr:glycosyltransferase family 4 protein [Actinomycetota bacterium]
PPRAALLAGDLARPTGGNLYDDHLIRAAPAHGFCLHPHAVPDRLPAALRGAPDALRRAARPPTAVLVIDSIAARGLGPALARRPPPVPVVALLHQPPGGGDGSVLRRGLGRGLDRLAYRRAGRLIVASTWLGDRLVRAGFDPASIRVVPPGCDVRATQGGPLPDLRRGRAAAILCVANWTAQKGILELVEAFARLEPGLATLHLVGDPRAVPAYGARVRRRLARSDLQGRVVVHGPRPPGEASRLRSAADVFALPAHRETYGMAWAEALRDGLPVVGWRSGHLPELVRDGSEGLLLPEGDLAGLTSALDRLCRDLGLRDRMRHSSRVRGSTLPTWSDTARRFFDVLREALELGPPAFQRSPHRSWCDRWRRS